MERPSPARAVTPGKGVRVCFGLLAVPSNPRPDAIGAVACFDGVYFGVCFVCSSSEGPAANPRSAT